jgi:hypothetical protein
VRKKPNIPYLHNAKYLFMTIASKLRTKNLIINISFSPSSNKKRAPIFLAIEDEKLFDASCRAPSL